MVRKPCNSRETDYSGLQESDVSTFCQSNATPQQIAHPIHHWMSPSKGKIHPGERPRVA